MSLAELPRAYRTRRNAALLAGCALALVLAAAPQRTSAQTYDRAFQGTETVVEGGASVFRTTNYSEINVTGAKTVINWAPTSTATSGTIDFLPEGTTAEFTSSTLTDYTVLNRILPGGTATIGLNGTITSSVFDGSEGQTAGGNVWFYTPNGFVVGPRAVINVGGLIMTTNDIVFGAANTGGDTLTDANGAILFRGGLNPASSITIQPGAQVSSSSYLALVSPRIVQSGTVTADRSIAYVAGEQVDLMINAGNFDIAIGQGTSDANGIVHTGTTNGSASSNFNDQKTISFVAVPKNTALTMLLSGDIDYSPAQSAFDDGSAIVLTAGDDDSPDGNISIGTTYFGNRLNAVATGDLTVAPTQPGPFSEGISTTTFASDASLIGGKSVTLRAVAGTAIVGDQSLSVTAGSAAGGGGVAIVEALGSGGFFNPGEIRVASSFNVSASHSGTTSDDGTTGSDGRGGSVTLRADGGTIQAGFISASADGYGGTGSLSGGDGYGGTVDLRAGLGGAIRGGFFNSLSAAGHGGASFDRNAEEPTGGQGGVGRGGTITIADSSGDAQADPTGGELGLGFLFANASAVGGNSASFGAGLGGDAFGGTIKIAFDRHNQTLGGLFADVTAADGDAAVDPLGGTIDMTVGGGITVNLGSLDLDASAYASLNGPIGAYGTGGTVSVTVNGGASLAVSGSSFLTSRAGISSFFFGNPDRSPDLTGGTVRLTVDNGSFTTRDLYVDVSASNVGANENAGFARGGTALIEAANGGTITTIPDESSGGTFYVDARASGSNGTFASDLTGGSITLSARSGATIEAGEGTLELQAGAYGFTESDGSQEGPPIAITTGNGANARGGAIAIDALGGTLLSPIIADVTGIGGIADGNGGSGTGGSIAVRVLGGELTGTLAARAFGHGGETLVSGNAGDGRGGRLTFASDADASFNGFGLNFDGSGTGASAAQGEGGDGHGGSAQVDILGGKHGWFEAAFDGSAQGGSSLGAGSTAGSAYGSAAGLMFHLGQGANLNTPFVSLNARAIAGANGAGNEAVGGIASVTVDSGAGLSVDGLGIDASASLAFEDLAADETDTTPFARGGIASVIADSGTISTSRLDVIANAQTGGAMTAAGSATGGTAIVGAANDGAIAIIPGSEGGGVVIQALGLGAEGPSAANATGGTATLYTAGGRFESPFDLVVRADASGGEFANSFNSAEMAANGFAATGGTASVEMRTGTGSGAIVVPSVTISAGGLADTVSSVLGAGGAGTGGTARLAVAQGTLDTGTVEIVAEGSGGVAGERPDGGAAHASGAGTGGNAQLRLTGGTVNTTGVSLSASGNGGDGAGGTSGATPSLAGSGTGGTALLLASGGTLNNSGSLSVDAYGFGGSGAFNPNAGPGGNGATGTGGTASLVAPAGSTANLAIGGPIVLNAIGSGGSSGESSSGAQGDGGAGIGGLASVSLADITFDFGIVTLNAGGRAGFGPNGNGTGGTAQFALAHTLSAAVAPRRIARLSLEANGTGSGTTTGGATGFTAQVGNPGSGLAITDDLFAVADGGVSPAGNGFTGSISGAPVTVGGQVFILTPRDATLTISGGGALQAGGDFTVDVGRSFTSSGPISTAANAIVIAPLGISMTDLAAGGTTLLQAVNGPVTVSRDLRSADLVAVLGRSVNLVSLGALSFADADATAGNLAIQTAGDLDLTTVDATGSVTLTSTGGSIHNTGAVNGVGISYTAAGDVRSDAPLASGGALSVDAGGTFSAPGTVSAVGNVSLSADLGMALAGVVSGGTTLLEATAGSVAVDSLTSPSAVTSRAREVTISSPGALSFTEAQATAGNLALTTAGNLTVAQGGASGAVNLTSTGGSVSGTGPITAGGNLAVTGQTGVTLGTATSGGTTSLTSSNGSVATTNLNSVGAVTARGRSVAIGSSGGLAFADLDATAGNIVVETAGNLGVATVDATGSVTLRSTGGALQASGAINGNEITLASLADLQVAGLGTAGAISLTSTAGSVTSSGPVTAGGTLTVAGDRGITLGTATSGEATSLSAPNGAIAVANLSSTGSLTAIGRSVDIASGGALSITDARATAGDLRLGTAGNLAIARASATGAATLASSGGTVSASGPVTAGGALIVAGTTGVSLGAAGSGGTTTLTSPKGTVQVANLASAGAVTAAGRAVDLRSTGTMNVAGAQASAGALNLQTGGALTVGTAAATGTANLAAGGDLRTTGLVQSAGMTVSGANVRTDGELRSSAALSLLAQQLLTINAAARGTTMSVAAGDITIGSGGRLGQRGVTQTLTITNQDAAKPMNLGGTGQSGEFSIDKAEAARLFADQEIALVARSSSSAPGEVRVGELAMAYGAVTSGANIGAGGLLKVDAPGRVEVNGAVALTTVSSGDRFSIDPTRIDVIAGTGSIAMRSAAGALQGILELQAGTIAVAERPILASIASASDFAAITRLLDQPTAHASEGALQAGSINLQLGDALYIQNTGASTAYGDRRGFLANQLSISSSSPSPRIAINGAIATPHGTLYGHDTSGAVTINGQVAAHIARGATITINGCAVGINCDVSSYTYGGRSEDELEAPVPSTEGGAGPVGELIQIEPSEPLITPPLVDEPITGVGNDDLWQPKCDPDGESEACPATTEAPE
jgi:filamentous hemagglutinin family protein